MENGAKGIFILSFCRFNYKNELQKTRRSKYAYHDFLLENGGSSVKYRTRRDILNDDIHSDEMQFIQKEILCKYQVRKLQNGEILRIMNC